jgi:branched-chain amino acid transport system permease protein
VFAFAYLGGIACISGAVSAGALVPGGIVFVTLQTVFKVPPEFTLILGALAVIAAAILNPEGIAGGLTARLRAIPARRRVPSAPLPRVGARASVGTE